MRLFVALEPPPDMREQLAGWARASLGGAGMPGHGGLRLLTPGMLHVTLCFLGEHPAAEVDRIARLSLGCAAPVGERTLGSPLWLPPRRSRVVAVSVGDPSGALSDLHAAVVDALALGTGFEPERRRFTPHITVARMRAGSAAAGTALAPTPAREFAAEALTLFRSRLAPSGASYEPLARVALS